MSVKQYYDIDWLKKELETGQRQKFVFFWGHTEKSNRVTKACLSQWYPATFVVDDIEYATAEHWMMAEKARLFRDDRVLDKILSNPKPGAAKAYGREIASFENEIWDAHKIDIVIQGNAHKFGQNADLGEYLLATGTRILVEASPLDKIWGIGLASDDPNAENPAKWKGPNWLGFALMAARDLLRLPIA